jgi:cyclic pyranopterin phosphate synthase
VSDEPPAPSGGAAERTLSHVGTDGRARMVDVSHKAATARTARAAGSIVMSATALAAVRDNAVTKGDVLAVARIAGVMAAKRTAELVPLCHQVPLSDVAVELVVDETLPGVRVETVARTLATTGVEMEAIVAATVALVTVYDMVKAIDKSMVLGDIRLLEKTGGKSGPWQRG